MGRDKMPNIDALTEELILADELMLTEESRKIVSPSGRWLEVRKVTLDEVPPPIEVLFKRFIAIVEAMNDDAKYPCINTIEREQVLGGANDVWALQIHDEDSPENPSGFSFYFQGTTYLGWEES